MEIGEIEVEKILENIEKIYSQNDNKALLFSIPLIEYFSEKEIRELRELVEFFNTKINKSKSKKVANRGLLNILDSLDPVVFEKMDYKPKGTLNFWHIKNADTLLQYKDKILSLIKKTTYKQVKVEVEDKIGYLIIDRRNIEIGSIDHVPFLFLKSIIPFGQKKDLHVVFKESTPESKKQEYKIKGDLSTSEKKEILKDRKKALQEKLNNNKHKIQISLDFEDPVENLVVTIKPSI